MTAASMPPIGAKVRATTTHFSTAGNTTVTVEGTVTAQLDEDRFVVGKPVGTVVRLTQDGPRDIVIVDVLSMPLPPEPPNHAFVHIAGPSGVGATAAQRVGRDGGRVDRWFLIGSERARTWAEICELGTVTPMVSSPATTEVTFPARFADPDGDRFDIYRVTDSRTSVRCTSARSSSAITVYLNADQSYRAGVALLAAAAAEEAGQQ